MCALGFASLGLGAGCAAIPTPLEPQKTGSLGWPHRGVIVDGMLMQENAESLLFLRDNGRRYTIPRFARALHRAAARVQELRPGAPAVLGDVSSARGGQSLPHFSHRNGRDVDHLFYVTTLEGVSVRSPGFVHFRADGLGYSTESKRWLRFDVERQWIFLKSLLEDPEARIQWAFFHNQLEHLLLDWAIALQEPEELVRRAAEVMLEPNPGGVHDDHMHFRTACSAAEQTQGCWPSGPQRSWWHDSPDLLQLPDDRELAASLFATPAESP